MKPTELEEIEVLSSTELIGDIPNAFMKLWRYRLRHIYKENRVSQEYNFDLLVTKFCDAVIVVPYCRHKDGTIMVALRYGTRPATYLRSRHTKINEGIHAAVFCELVAGGVEDSDYTEVDGIRNRAAKEVFEEAGFSVHPSQLVRLGTAAFTAPGFAIEKLHFFCVEVDPTDQRANSTADDVHEEVGELEFRELSDALTMCRTGKIEDQKTEVALFRFASLIGLIPALGLNTRQQLEQRQLENRRTQQHEEDPVDRPKGLDDKKSEITDEASRLHLSDDKQAEMISSLRDRAWASFDERRRHEYKISLTFWAIYLVTIGYVLRLEESLKPEAKLVLSGTMLSLALVYLIWNLNLAKTQQLDRTMAIYYGDRLMESCGIKKQFYERFKIGKKTRVMGSTQPKQNSFLKYVWNWNHGSEAVVTIILAIASIAVIYWKS